MKSSMISLLVVIFSTTSSAEELKFRTTELQCLFGSTRPKTQPIVAHSPSQYEDTIWKGFHDALQEFLVSQQQNIYFATPDYRERVKNAKLKTPGKYEYQYMLKIRPDLKRYFEAEENPMLLMESCRYPDVNFDTESIIFAYLEGCLSSYEITGNEDKEQKKYIIKINGIQTNEKCVKPIVKDLMIIFDTPNPNYDITATSQIEKR